MDEKEFIKYWQWEWIMLNKYDTMPKWWWDHQSRMDAYRNFLGTVPENKTSKGVKDAL